MLESSWDHRGPQVTMEMKGFLQIRKADALTEQRVNVSRRRGKRTMTTKKGKVNIRSVDGAKKRLHSKNEQRANL